jgi:hypothetical protein
MNLCIYNLVIFSFLTEDFWYLNMILDIYAIPIITPFNTKSNFR